MLRGECSHFSIPGNGQEDSGKCSRKLWGMLLKIPGNAIEDSGKYRRFFLLKKANIKLISEA